MNKLYQTPIVLFITIVSIWLITYSRAPQNMLQQKVPVFKTVVLVTDDALQELTTLVGRENVSIVLLINRIDANKLAKNASITIPESFDDPNWWQSMPQTLSSAGTIPKLVVVSVATQSFGVYELGKLVRSGPVSTGKQSSQTPPGVYHMNWKGEEVQSSFDDEWTLKWNFNIDNKRGISLHEYALPGYPASHACVRLYSDDAQWIYAWGDQWTLAPRTETKLLDGTPVLIYGQYDFDSPAPWTQLAQHPYAMRVSADALNKAIEADITNIMP